MHMHSVAAGAAGNSLAGAALAAETALATRRAQQLRDAGRKLKATSLDSGLQFADQLHSDPQLAEQPSSSVGAVQSSDAGAGSSAQASAESFARQFTADTTMTQPQPQLREIQPVAPSAPLSYWA